MTTPPRSAAPCRRTLRDLFARAGVPIAGAVSVPDVKIVSLTDDSRALEPGGCFVAVRGVERDGHDFIEAAARAGAVAIVVDQDVTPPGAAVCIRVADTRVALAKLASAAFGLCGEGASAPRLIGITGTNGKTTVGWLLRSILQAADRRPALIGTIVYDLLTAQQSHPLTTPDPLALCRHVAAARDAGATDIVLEVSSHALDQRRCDGLSFAAGVFTNLSSDHLDYHKTMESYARAKRRLFDGLGPDAVAVMPHNDTVAEWMVARCRARRVTFGLGYAGAHVQGRLERMDATGSRFVAWDPSFETTVTLSLLGRHNVINALAATATAHALGIGPSAIRAGLERVAAVPGRLQRAEPAGCPFTVLIDYAHTEDALRSALTAIRAATQGRLICLFGCGGDRDRDKRPRMAATVAELADVAYVTSDNPRTEDPRAIIDEILPGFDSAEPPASAGAMSARPGEHTGRCNVVVEVDRRAAIAAAIGDAKPGDTVLIAGKGHEDYQIISDKVLSFDDLAVARDCLKSQRAGTGNRRAAVLETANQRVEVA